VPAQAKTRVLIMGAAGRDFHNFNTVFRNNPLYQVVAFTATQIPGIASRVYPASLAGEGYPDGIPIYPEDDLLRLIGDEKIDLVVFAYSDVSHEYVMHRASAVIAAGASFQLLGARQTMLPARKPVVAIGAVRTGSGKSQTTRRVAGILKGMNLKTVVVRHPMPYGDLEAQAVQRFADYDDLDKYHCTIEEREEYEPHLDRGNVVYAGVDYEQILRQAEAEADVVLWDGGNNDLPFFKPDLLIVVADPLRPGHEQSYHPGEANARLADVLVINKVDTASADNVLAVRTSLQKLNPDAILVEADSPIYVEDPAAILDRKVVVVEDGPTLTHGEMSFGAGIVAARRFGAQQIIDPRPYAVGSLQEVYRNYPHIGPLLPAMGYGEKQMQELKATLNAVPADLVVIATPINLCRLLKLELPSTQVRYELLERTEPNLETILKERLKDAIPRV